MEGHPILDEEEEKLNNSAFDMLFNRNVVHILESIFFSLDYKSFKNCPQVCKQWNHMLSSEHFQKMAKTMFSVEMWMDRDSLKLIGTDKDSKDLWTYKGEEVAYTEFVEGAKSGYYLHYIDPKGKSHSTKLLVGSGGFSKVYILKYVIMLISVDDSNQHSVVYVSKEEMSQSKVYFPETCRQYDHIESRIHSSVYLAIYKKVPLCERYTLWLGRISEDMTLNGHNLRAHHRGFNLFADHERCCYIQKCEDFLAHPKDSPYGSCDFFSPEGAYFVSSNQRIGQKDKIDITSYKLYKNKGKCLWSRTINAYGHVRICANSKYVVVLIPKGVVIFSLEDGEIVKKISLWTNKRQNRWYRSNVIISQKHLLACRDVLPDEHDTTGTEVFRLDLDTLAPDRFTDYTIRTNIISMHVINGGKVVALLEKTHSEKRCYITIPNLSSNDIEMAFNNRQTIYKDYGWLLKDFREVSEGICAFQAKNLTCTRHHYISLKSVRIPIALDRFFSDADK